MQTRQAIRRAAYRLFSEQGYDATPVHQIAEEANVSIATIFRYFPTKEDIVLTDEYDPIKAAALRSRPAGEPPLAALRNAILDSLRPTFERDQPEISARVKLMYEVPAIRARISESTRTTGRVLAEVLAQRCGRPIDDLEMRVLTAIVLSAFHEALMYWVEGDLRGDFIQLVERALNVVCTSLPE